MADPLKLEALFDGAEDWRELLAPTIEAQPGAERFIGPDRASSIVPVRELTFQALKPHKPQEWKVVIFGQNPYPRVESATGIAMFDNAFGAWKDSQFGRVTSIRCIIKAACIWKLGIDPKTKVAEIRSRLAKEDIVAPPEWFQGMLTQGVLLLNASLTASIDKSISTSQHTSFWRPVVRRILESILEAKNASENQEERGVVFAWWGAHAKTLRKLVESLAPKYPNVRIKHVDHCNPAAMGDAFCKGNHFGDINDALETLSMSAVDWLPKKGWDADAGADAQRMGDFISETMELHKTYLERLQDVEEILEELVPITGVMDRPLPKYGDAVKPLIALLKNLKFPARAAHQFAAKAKSETLTKHEIAALYLYTTQSSLYRQLNATLRHPDRSRIEPYLNYLRLFASALSKISTRTRSLYRGVALDLRRLYPKGGSVVWWGVSSCTPKLSVATGFLGNSGKRTLFRVATHSAVSIQAFSAYKQEEEYILRPGTQLQVDQVSTSKGLTTIDLIEATDAPLVS
ncbi:MAG: ADP-ribosyltransferase domain-containing protein [Myxococcota bacterium]